MTYRSPKLIAAVRSLPCTWPMAHACDAFDGPCEPAHSNQLRDGKGRGLKAHDYRVAALCHAAHAELDQGNSLNREQKVVAFDEAHRRTIGLLFERGLVVPK